MAGSTGLEPATLWIDSRGQPTAAPKRLVVSGQIKLREIDGHAPRRSTTRRNREGIRERHEPGYVRRGDSQSEAQLQDPAERDRTFLLGPSQPLRHPFHGWPDRFGFLDSTQAMFNPQGGPGDDLCAPPAPRYPVCISLVTAHTLTGDVPVQPALARPPQPITAPLALEPSDVAAVGHDFAPDSFVFGVVRKGASLVSREGDFGFSKENGEPPAGHDVELVNFSGKDERFSLEQSRFAFNCKQSDQLHDPDGAARCAKVYDQAFVA